MPTNALYTDLSGYYDLMCADIDYQTQSDCVRRLHQLFGASGRKNKIDNTPFVSHSAEHDNSTFVFRSGWYYCGQGERQSLKLSIQKTTLDLTESWQDEHPMVALGFEDLASLLEPYFEVHIFEHDYERIQPWDGASGNALFVCVKA